MGTRSVDDLGSLPHAEGPRSPAYNRVFRPIRARFAGPDAGSPRSHPALMAGRPRPGESLGLGSPIRGLSHRPARTAPDPATTQRFGGFAENGLIRARSEGCQWDSISYRSNTQRPGSASRRSVWSGAGCRSTCWDLAAAPTGGSPVV